MGFAEVPVTTDAEYIKKELCRLNDAVEEIRDTLAAYRTGLNSIGANVNWLTENTQGLFQMFTSPAFMNQMMGTMTGLGGVSLGGRAEDGPEDGPEDGF